MKDAAFLEQLQQELPRRSLSPKATQRFEDTYKMLGVQQEAPVKKRRHKGLWVTATAACLCCGMLFGVNAAFPAFAEGLPGVGRFFEAVNSSFQTIGNSKAAHGANVGTYDTQDVNVAASSGDYSMEVLEAFSDGKNLTFSMDVTTTSELWNRYDWVGVGSNLNGETTTLTVNGTPVETSFSDTLERGEDNHYTGAVSFALPEAVEDGTELNVEFSVTQLTFPDKFTYEGYVYVDVDWNSAFTVTADASGNKAFAADASDAGVEILNVDASATETLVTTNIPDWYDSNFYPYLYTLDGTELAISESQERMAVVVEEKDAARFMELADQENLEATVVAAVTGKGRLTMTWNGKKIVDIARAFLDTNGVEKHITAVTAQPESILKEQVTAFRQGYLDLAGDLNVCSKRGLAERFDATIGSGTVLMPFGGQYQLTPTQAMVNQISMEEGSTDTCSLMSWGYNPYICLLYTSDAADE